MYVYSYICIDLCIYTHARKTTTTTTTTTHKPRIHVSTLNRVMLMHVCMTGTREEDQMGRFYA